MVIWAANFIVVKDAIRDFPPVAFTMLRHGLASVALIAILRWYEGRIRLPHPELVNALEVGDIVKLDDGKLQLTIIERGRTQLKARVDFGGVLKDQKGVNVPTRRIPISALTRKDREDLAYALDLGVDYIALSFVQHPEDVREAKALIGDRARAKGFHRTGGQDHQVWQSTRLQRPFERHSLRQHVAQAG